MLLRTGLFDEGFPFRILQRAIFCNYPTVVGTDEQEFLFGTGHFYEDDNDENLDKKI